MCVHFKCFIGVKKKGERKGYPSYVFGEQGWRRVKRTTSHQCGLASSPGVNALCVGLLFVNMRFPSLRTADAFLVVPSLYSKQQEHEQETNVLRKQGALSETNH